MSEKTLKFNNSRLNKKEFHKSKDPTDLLPIDLDLTNLLFLTNLNVMMKALSISLVTSEVKLLNNYALFYLK